MLRSNTLSKQALHNVRWQMYVLTLLPVRVPVLSKHTVSTEATVLILSGSKKSIFLCLRRNIPAPMAHTSTAGMKFLERSEKFTLFSDHDGSLLRRRPRAMTCLVMNPGKRVMIHSQWRNVVNLDASEAGSSIFKSREQDCEPRCRPVTNSQLGLYDHEHGHHSQHKQHHEHACCTFCSGISTACRLYT